LIFTQAAIWKELSRSTGSAAMRSLMAILFPVLLNVVHEKQLRALRKNVSQLALALDQRQIAKVASAERQEIEGAEGRLPTAKEKFIELRAAALVQAGDLPVHDGILDTQKEADRLAERIEAGKAISVAGD